MGRVGSLFIDHYGKGWWIVEGLSTLLIGWTLHTLLPAIPSIWAWLPLIASFVCWVLFVALAWWFPRLATGAVAGSSMFAAVAYGAAGDLVLVMICIALSVFASHPIPSVRMIIVVSGLDVGLVVLGSLLTGSSPTSVLAAVATMLVMVLLGLNRRQYQVQAEQTERLLEQTRRTQHEQARAAALDERARIAREMHDVLAHSLGALAVQLEVAEAQLAERDDPDAALARVRRSRRMATEGLVEARNAVAALRRDVPALPDAIQELAAEHNRNHPGTASVSTDGEARPVSSAATVSLLDTTREALTNAAKHAPGVPVTITLHYQGPEVRLAVRNEAPPEPSAPESGRPNGFGLTGMRERLALAGGTLTAGVDDRAGWSVTATVPVDGGNAT